MLRRDVDSPGLAANEAQGEIVNGRMVERLRFKPTRHTPLSLWSFFCNGRRLELRLLDSTPREEPKRP